MGRKKTIEEYNKEYAGKVFGNVRIDEYSHRDKNGKPCFWCRCLRCDVKFGPVRLRSLKSGSTTSCGHCSERTEIGNRYGSYIIKEFHHRKNRQAYFLCECDCGEERIVLLNNLKSGSTTSCGHCLERTEIGNRYGHLVIKEFHHRDKNNNGYFLCECDCGNESVVYLGSLKSGRTTSCGHCLERTEIGNRYGHLVIKEFHHRDKNGQLLFLCECDCGNESVVQLGSLKSGNTTSCGHCSERTEIGNRYGHWVVKEFHHRDKGNNAYFLCECDCGNESVVYLGNLKSGKTTSCGCRTESIGEEKIRLMLEKMGVKFEQEYLGFTDMRDKNVLRCDFWLPGFNRVIEFDGPQHFEPINMFGGERVFRDTQRRDQIKNQYCWDHGIDIVRIPYWEIDNFTIEDLVNKYTKYLIKEEKEIKNAGI